MSSVPGSSNKRESVRSQKDFFLNSIKETDQKIKQIFDDIIEERKNTQKFLKDNYERVVTPTSNANNISFPSAGKTSVRFESKKTSSATRLRPSSNTSALFENDRSALDIDDDDDNYTEFGTQFTRNSSAKKNNSAKKSNLKKIRRFDLDQEHVLTISNGNSANKQDQIKIEDNYVTLGVQDTENILTQDFNSSIGSPIDPSKLMNSFGRERRGKLSASKTGDSKRYSGYKGNNDYDDGISDDGGLLDTLKSDDFALANTLELCRKSAQASKDQPLYQVSKTELNFGTLFPTENQDQSFEIFNKMNKDLEFDVSIIGGDYNVFRIKIGKNSEPRQSNSVIITKFSFTTVEVLARTTLYGQENRQLNAQVRIVCGEKESVINLACKIEKPCLQLMNGCVDRIVGQVPFISFDSGAVSDSKMQIYFRNTGTKQIQLEIELVEDSRLCELLFSPKYLTIPKDSEKTLVVRAVSQFENTERRKSILKYKIRGTKLQHCIVITFHG